MNDLNIQGKLLGGGELSKALAFQSKGSRREFEKFRIEMPHHVNAKLNNGELTLADQIIYSIKPIGGSKTVKFFETQDDKRVGLRNISNAKLGKNHVLMCSGIYLLAGIAPASVSGSATPEEIMATYFDSIDSKEEFACITNGEWDLKFNKKQIVPETSCRCFVTSGFGKFQKGYYKLANPRPLADDELIEFTLELGSTFNLPADTYGFVGLEGTVTTP